jgi:hypothetical protein
MVAINGYRLAVDGDGGGYDLDPGDAVTIIFGPF